MSLVGSQVKRRCTMCSEVFSYTRQMGRPPAFCSEECKTASRSTKVRHCIACKGKFTLTNQPGCSPFYCSEQCQLLNSLCIQCGMPCESGFCSKECVLGFYPLPWECTVCKSDFTPKKKHWDEPRSLKGRLRYCSSECYDRRRQPAGKFWINSTNTAEWIMLRASGAEIPVRGHMPTVPFTGIDPAVVPDPSTLNPKAHNSINFWKFVLELDSIETGDLVLTAMRRGFFGGSPWEIMPLNTLWPWIEPLVTSTHYNRSDLERMLTGQHKAMRAFRKLKKIKELREIEDLVMEADYAMKVYKGFVDLKLDDPDYKNDRRKINNFVKRYCTPNPAYAVEVGHGNFSAPRTLLQRLFGNYIDSQFPWEMMGITEKEWDVMTIPGMDASRYDQWLWKIAAGPVWGHATMMIPENPYKLDKRGRYTTEATAPHDYEYKFEELPWGPDLRYEIAMEPRQDARMAELFEKINSPELTTEFHAKTTDLASADIW